MKLMYICFIKKHDFCIKIKSVCAALALAQTKFGETGHE